jgi:hypothetical protein
MSTFAEYLKSKGADDSTIAAMDTPLAREVYEQMTARAAEADTLRTNMKAYETKVNDYYTETKSQAEKRERDLMLAEAEAARSKAAILSLQKQGLIDVAKDLGFDPATPPAAAAATPKYVTEESLFPYIDNAGEGLAAVMDAMDEHKRLFPNVPFSAQQIRREAVAAKKPFYEYWETKFKVADARASAAKAAQESHDKEIADKARAEERAKLASEYGSPLTRPAVPSTSPFIPRKADNGQAKQPWGRSEDENSNDRVRRATENVIKRSETAVH